MNQFSLEVTLDTREPFAVDFLGPPSGVTYNISGTLKLQTQKTLQLKQLSVTFLGQVKSEPMPIDKVEYALIESQKTYPAGEHSIPFQLMLPGDIATTDSSQLTGNSLQWEYFLVASATPTGLLGRRKEFKNRLKVRRVHVEPSSNSQTRFSACRKDRLDCSIYVPKFMNLGRVTIPLSIYTHPYMSAYCIKEIQAYAFQNEWIEFGTELYHPEKRGKRISVNTKRISNVVVISNPNDSDFAADWGREASIDLELDLLPSEMVPSELLVWVKISHGVCFTIVFQDESIKPLVVKAPFTAVRVLEDPWTNIISRTEDRGAADGETLPEYGEEIEHSTLLDSNTNMMLRGNLYRDLYPERSESAVPDVEEELPPMYARDEEQPEPYSESAEKS
ncbi:hypothetical protein BGZ46_007704 [Entomortierella lignicola]|nr:hypothetical protein BGZ46_007704 [Entomortierella lignicola]